MKLELDARQYDILYTAVACAAPTDIRQVRTAARILGRLEEQGVRDRETGMYVRGDESPVVVNFDEDEARVARELIERRIPQLQTWAAVRILPVFDALGEEDVER